MRTLFERLAAVFSEGGHARVVAFLALSRDYSPALDGVTPLANAVHATRLMETKEGQAPPPFEDSYFTVLLVSFALFGDAIAGSLFRGERADELDPAARARFRAWLAKLVQTHIEPPP